MWLLQSNTYPNIIRCLSATLHDHSIALFLSLAHPSCQQAASTQDQIGFFSFLLSCFSLATLENLAGKLLAVYSLQMFPSAMGLQIVPLSLPSYSTLCGWNMLLFPRNSYSTISFPQTTSALLQLPPWKVSPSQAS